ncbi:hypothetical protein AXF42_Ash017245 [Apostasia shenzhenica]|uniref:Dilute domain-containing protein n=1 Tax=Apostasia shenzhenica TaxID=1088818 RepID=A0A2H9ZVI0_9ASPA|nr:hypothetical protein AXF42_Ash017245 [Apostasia shenzhenica]
MSAKENGDERLDHSTEFEKESKLVNGESDYDLKNSRSLHNNEEYNMIKKDSRAFKKPTKKESGEGYLRQTKASSFREEQKKQQVRSSNHGSKKSQNPNKVASPPKDIDAKNLLRYSSELSEEADDKTIEEVKEIDVLDEAPICDQSVGTDDSMADAEENNLEDVKLSTHQKIHEMELRIEKLEQELREAAAIEISLYSIIPEHGSSAHKVHTPARRLARFYIFACKFWSQDKRATVARNTISGLVLIAKSCGTDVPRLTFWLSNIVVLRAMVSQTFGYSPSATVILWPTDSKHGVKMSDRKTDIFKSKSLFEGKKSRRLGFFEQVDDWQEISTFIAALDKLETWIFFRTVESVWWQTLTPHMQPPIEDLHKTKGIGKLLGPALGDPQQGSFSINIWKCAFHDAFSKLCPVRSGGHECGCLPVLARLVVEQCISRLDVAMFNAILRESANEMPTDPLSDPIVDPKVLPIPAGHLSFGSGAQLKNSIGNWARLLMDLFGLEVDNSTKNEVNGLSENDGSKCFRLLNELSDLLMLPKDMLLDRNIRKEVCPSIGLPIITRVLCNFTPDEFCPDSVPGSVLEELNSESVNERSLLDEEKINTFPCSASPVTYSPPSSIHLAEKVGSSSLERNASTVMRRGYTSDEDLDGLDDPFTSVIEAASPGVRRVKQQNSESNRRYLLLREVWRE